MMGLWDRLRSAFGFSSTPEHERDLILTEGALARLEALSGQDQGLSINTIEKGFTRIIRVLEGTLPPDAPRLEQLPVAISEADRGFLRGMKLDHDGRGWLVKLSLSVWASETPNPAARLYRCSRPLALGRSHYLRHGGAGKPLLGASALGLPGVQSALFRGEHMTLELKQAPGDWAPLDKAVDQMLRTHFLGCGGPIPAETRVPRADPFEREVEDVIIEHVLPALHRDGGDLTLLSIEDGVVNVLLSGACKTCPSSSHTLRVGVEATLKRHFGGRIREVVAAGPTG